MTAFLLFAQLNTALVNAGGEPILVPPTASQYPLTLPKQVSLVSSALGKFTLTLQSSPYAGKVVEYAAEPVMAGTNVYKESAFKVIGFLPSLGVGGTNLASLYAAAFRAPQSGEKVAIKIMGVSPAGCATMKQFVAAVTNAAAAEAAEDGSAEAVPLMLTQ